MMQGNCCGNAWTPGLTRCTNCPLSLQHGYYTAPNMGWQCPMCRVVHAPTVMQCHCQNWLGGPTSAAVVECMSASQNCRKNNPSVTECCSLYSHYAAEREQKDG